MSVHPCRGNEVRPRQQAFQCDDYGFWQHRIFVFYFRITISVTSNDSERINLSFTSQHLYEFIPCDLLKMLLFFKFKHSTKLRDTTQDFGRYDYEFLET